MSLSGGLNDFWRLFLAEHRAQGACTDVVDQWGMSIQMILLARNQLTVFNDRFKLHECERGLAIFPPGRLEMPIPVTAMTQMESMIVPALRQLCRAADIFPASHGIDNRVDESGR